MSGTATKRQTTTKTSAKQAEQASQGLTIDELERQQREVEQAIEAKREKEQATAWATLGRALPLAARGEPFDANAVKEALAVVGLSFNDFKCDAKQYSSAQDPPDDELTKLGMSDHELSAHIRKIREDAEAALHAAKCEGGRLRGLIQQRGHRRQSLRALQAKGYCIHAE